MSSGNCCMTPTSTTLAVKPAVRTTNAILMCKERAHSWSWRNNDRGRRDAYVRVLFHRITLANPNLTVTTSRAIANPHAIVGAPLSLLTFCVAEIAAYLLCSGARDSRDMCTVAAYVLSTTCGPCIAYVCGIAWGMSRSFELA